MQAVHAEGVARQHRGVARPRQLWRGRIRDGERSGRLSEFLSLLMPGMEFYCLQKDISESERALLASHPAIRIFDDQVADFSDTAALCEMMDLVITIDYGD